VSAGDFVGIADAKMIYVGIADRAAFDKIDLAPLDHGDGPRGHVITKRLEDAGVTVVFQHWLKPPPSLGDAA
jgi:hypothetical protein